MLFYAVQVKTRGEDEYVRKNSNLNQENLSFIVPKRAVVIRKKGTKKKDLATVFPGYVFLCLSEHISPSQRWAIRHTQDFYRFLPSNQKCLPLSGRDLDLLTHFISFGEHADISKVIFDENDRVVVLEGPLKGLEGLIEKVDRRKKRAKIRLDMCHNSFLIDLAFTVVERATKGQPEPHGESRGT